MPKILARLLANFATATDALTAGLATVDARLRNIDVNEKLELYIELADDRATIQQAIGAVSGGACSEFGQRFVPV